MASNSLPPAGSSSSSPGPRSPSRRVLKGTILWCARWILGGGEFYRGSIQVEVTAAREGERVVVEPRRGADGLTEPEPLGVREEVAEATPAELLRVLFSRDEIRILSEMLRDKGVKASWVMDVSKVEKSKFWPLWSNLQQRGIVSDADDDEGFVIGLPWVRELIAAKVGGGTEGRPAA